MNELQEKFKALTEREQLLVLISAVVVVIFLFYFVVWQPLQTGIAKQTSTLEKQTEMLDWVQSQAVKATQLRSLSGKKSSFKGSLPQAVNATSARHQIAISRMQPQSEELQVWVDEAEFNKVLAWLQSLEKMGILIKQVDISESNTPGIIRIRRLQLGKV